MNALTRLLQLTATTLVVLGLGTMTALGQALDCPALFRAALQTAAQNCSGLERNEACLAAGSIDFTPADGYEGTTFAQPGDRVEAAAIDQLTQTSADAWALTVIRLQLNQPEESEHTSVMMLLGDVTLTAVEPPARPPLPTDEVREVPAAAPLSAFDFAAQGGACADELPNGVLLQSPNLVPGDEGYVPTELRLNGWDVVMGSTVYAAQGADGVTIMDVLEHFGFVSNDAGDSAMVEGGQSADLPSMPSSDGSRWVSSEDGSVVVVDGLQTAQTGISDHIRELLDEGDLGNRPVPESSSNDLLSAGTPWQPAPQGTGPRRPRVVADGFWFADQGMSSTFGMCMMQGFDVSWIDGVFTLDEVFQVADDGELLSYRWGTMGMIVDLPLDQVHRQTYRAVENNPIGSTMFEIEVKSPFAVVVTVLQTISGVSNQVCFIETPIVMQSCIVDVFYGMTRGGGLCPWYVHQAMGTYR